VIGKPLIGLGDAVRLALGGSVGHTLSYSVRLLGAFAPMVGVVLRFHGFLPRVPSIRCNAKVIAGFPAELKFFARQEKMLAVARQRQEAYSQFLEHFIRSSARLRRRG
jgi:hypothetical protein